MKYPFILKIYICVVMLFLSMNLIFTLSNKSKIKSRLSNRMKVKKTVIKMRNLKKDGPLSWETLNDDKMLESFLRNERMANNRSYANVYQNVNNNNRNMKYELNTNNTPVFLGGKNILSENQKSKTFRPVSPFEDSTKNFTGKKYSQLYRSDSNRNINSGYYGRSRLTRL